MSLDAGYGFQFNVRYCLSCEKEVDRRQLAATQHDTAFVVADMEYLVNDTCENVAEELSEGGVNAEPEIIPHFHEISTGFPCTNRTPQASNSKSMVNCIQENRGVTGGGYRLTEEIILKHDPDAATLENVIGCAQEANGKQSDASWMVVKLRGHGFWCILIDSDAIEYLSPLHRRRLYWPLLNSRKIPGLVNNFNKADHFFFSIFNNLRVNVPGTITDCIIIGHAARAHLSASAGFPLLKGTGLRVSEHPGSSPDWKTTHLQYFQQWQLDWPVVVEDHMSTIEPGGLLPREFESAVFLHHVFGPAEFPHADHVSCTLQGTPVGDTIGSPICSLPEGEVFLEFININRTV